MSGTEGQALGTAVKFAMAVAEMLHLESVGLVILVVDGIQFVNGDLVAADNARHSRTSAGNGEAEPVVHDVQSGYRP